LSHGLSVLEGFKLDIYIIIKIYYSIRNPPLLYAQWWGCIINHRLSGIAVSAVLHLRENGLSHGLSVSEGFKLDIYIIIIIIIILYAPLVVIRKSASRPSINPLSYNFPQMTKSH
jgi:hypothetical protein